MVGLVLLTLLNSYLTSNTVQKPSIVNVELGDNQCDERDPFYPCFELILTLYNPLYRETIVELACGKELHNNFIKLSPRARHTIHVTPRLPNNFITCRLVKWK